MGYYHTDRERHRTYQREWMRQRRSEWLAENGPCVRCGSTQQLEIDHIDRTTKKYTVVWSRRAEHRLAELAKCQVLCRPCHIRKGQEVGDIPGPAGHGTKSEYRRGCRCEACRTWEADRKRRRKAHRAVLARAA